MRYAIDNRRPAPETDPAAGPDPNASLRRYLGPDLAASLLGGSSRPHDIFAAWAQLASARYAVSTYLPRRLVARQIDTAQAGPWLEWVEGSLLFTDVSGSTALAERLGSLGREGTEIVTDTLNSYFGTMITIIERAGGDLLTFGGDALLVLFTGERHTHAASATALALLHDLRGFKRHVPGIGTFPLSMHIGVESGRVALVSAGQPQALRYSAMGQAVNAVARAESYGGKGELVLGPHAWAAVAAVADGDELAEGFVRLRRLAADLPVAPPAPDAQAPTLNLSALARLATQIDRITPYLPHTLLDRILADPQQPRVEADLRPVTVLFAQVCGLTDLVEALPPPAAAAAVDAFLHPMQAAVQQYGGFVNKLDLAEEGEKLLAIFGAPQAYEDHAERAARAALAMMAGIAEAQVRLPIAQSPHLTVALQLRIGINTGIVFAGNVGTAERKEYTVMGDAVNVAARVLVNAAWGEVRCTASTAALIGDGLLAGDPRQVTVKGKAEPIELLRLEGERAVAPALVAAAPLVGRDAELAWLRAHRLAAAAGAGRAARLSGEAGIGKSRLVASLIEESRRYGDQVLSVRCHSFNTSTPYAPWGDLLRELCAIAPDDGQDARAAKLAAALAAADIPADDWLPLVADLVRLEGEDSIIVRALDPQQRQARRFEIVLQLLRARARGPEQAWLAQTLPQDPQSAHGVLVIVFDNLHWADQVSLDLWQYVAAHIADAPILLLGLHRGDLAWGSGHQGDSAAALTLAELDPTACAQLLQAIDPALEPELREPIISRAAGNPLFLEELLRAVHGSQTGVDTLPDSLSGLLLARLDQLDERSRALLRIASVIGQRFPLGVLQSIQHDDQQALLRHLTHLDNQELTSLERETPERVHLFRHALMQEVTYQSLLYARRRELHRKIGEHLERRYADELARVQAEYSNASAEPLVQIGRNGSLLSRAARGNSAPIFLLAHHYRLSDAPERAVPYLLLAGHTARDDYANDQAVQSYRWALEVLSAEPMNPRTWEARESLGDVLCTLGRYDEAQQEYAALLSDQSGVTSDRPPLAASGSAPVTPHASLPPAVAAEVLRSWGESLEKQGRYHEALEKLHQAEATVVALINQVPPLLLAAICADMGTVLRRLGEYEQALSVCEAGLARLRNDRRSAEDERIEADLQQQIGTIHGMRGQYDQAQFHFTNALAALEAIDDLYGCARTHNNLGYLAQLQSRYDTAVGHYEQAEALARKVSARYIIAGVQLNAAYCYYRLDRYAEAAAACDDVRLVCAEIGDQDGVAKSYDLCGNIAFNRGNYPEAIECHTQALAIHRELGGSYDEGNSLALLALAHVAMGADVLARDLADQALAIAERIQMPKLIVEALSAQARADLLAADTASAPAPLIERAAELAARAAELAAQISSRLDYGVARRLQGEVAARRGQPFGEHFLAAAASFAAIPSDFELARTWASHGAALAACNDPSAATYLFQAEETFKRVGAAGELRRLPTSNERSL